MKKPFQSLFKCKNKYLYPFSIPAIRAKYKSNETFNLNELADDYLELLKLKSKINFEELNNFYLEEVNK